MLNRNNKIKNVNFQKGAVSILFGILLLSLLIVISSTAFILMFQQIKMSGQAGHSVLAFYAAESGAERCLYHVRCVRESVPTAECIAETGPGLNLGCASIGVEITGNLYGGAAYRASRENDTSINSVGEYLEATRRLRLSW